MNRVLIVLVLFAYITTIHAGEGNYNQAELMRVQDPKSASVASRLFGIVPTPPKSRSTGKSTFKICNTLLHNYIVNTTSIIFFTIFLKLLLFQVGHYLKIIRNAMVLKNRRAKNLPLTNVPWHAKELHRCLFLAKMTDAMMVAQRVNACVRLLPLSMAHVKK